MMWKNRNKKLEVAYVFEGRRYDVGDKLGFLEATVEFALKRDDLKVPFMKYLQTLKYNENFSGIYDEVACSSENIMIQCRRGIL